MRPIILTRFSFISDTLILSTQFKSTSEYREYLFEDERLNYRFALFETLCLPSLIAQTDPEFTLVLLVSEEFPEWAYIRLRDLVAPLRDARIYRRSPGTFQVRFQEILDEDFPIINEPRLTICLDDDDAISIDWIEESKRIYFDAQSFVSRFGEFGFFPNLGMVMNLNDEEVLIRVSARTPHASGLSHIAGKRCKNNVYSTRHATAPRKWPMFSTCEKVNFLHVLHNANMSYLNFANIFRNEVPLQNQDFLQNFSLLKERFAVEDTKINQIDAFQDVVLKPHTKSQPHKSK